MMPIEINELTSHIEVRDGAGISKEAMHDIIHAVLKALKDSALHEEAKQGDLDTRSIVDQQRGGRR